MRGSGTGTDMEHVTEEETGGDSTGRQEKNEGDSTGREEGPGGDIIDTEEEPEHH